MATATATTFPASFHDSVHQNDDTHKRAQSIGNQTHQPSEPFELAAGSVHRHSSTLHRTTGNDSTHSLPYEQNNSNADVLPTTGVSINRTMSPFFAAERTSLYGPRRSDSPVILDHSSKNGLDSSLNSNVVHSRPRSKSFTEKTITTLSVPISLPLIILCLSWYLSSAVSNTLNKSILNVFPYPVTLTMIQFLMAVSLGVTTIQLSQFSPTFYNLLPAGTVSPFGVKFPTREILMFTLPMGIFQLFGHIFSHMATSQIPVSLVHTIKALSPLFTVAAYRFVFKVQYPLRTYFSLIPLTSGVIMTCSAEFSSQMKGIIYALVAALIFVSQNIYSKKLLTYRPESSASDSDNTPRIDKLNILCYCSSLAFILTSPLWLFSEGIRFFSDYYHSVGPLFGSQSDHIAIGTLFGSFLINGLSHFLQNLLAFQVLGMVSPVTYSVASLIKRIVVITVAIVWFGQKVNPIQRWGIVLTFLGLYLYDRLGGDRTKQNKYMNITLHNKPSLPK